MKRRMFAWMGLGLLSAVGFAQEPAAFLGVATRERMPLEAAALPEGVGQNGQVIGGHGGRIEATLVVLQGPVGILQAQNGFAAAGLSVHQKAALFEDTSEGVIQGFKSAVTLDDHELRLGIGHQFFQYRRNKGKLERFGKKVLHP